MRGFDTEISLAEMVDTMYSPPALKQALHTSEQSETDTKTVGPRTDCKSLELWTDFPSEVAVTQSLLQSTTTTLLQLLLDRKSNLPDSLVASILAAEQSGIQTQAEEVSVIDEFGIESFADMHLFGFVSTLYSALLRGADVNAKDTVLKGPPGAFHNINGMNHLIGNPNRVWVPFRDGLLDEYQKPTLVVQVKTFWSIFMDDPEWLVNTQKTLRVLEQGGKLENSRIDAFAAAISQLYGYMAFNSVTFGVLTTYKQTWIFHRKAGGESLLVSGPYDSGKTLFEVFLTVIRLSGLETTPATVSNSNLKSLRSFALQRCLAEDGSRVNTDEEVSFEKMLARGATGSAILGIINQKSVVFKTADLSVNGNLGTCLDKEVQIYLGLKASDMAYPVEQRRDGVYWPRFLGQGNIWQILNVLILEYAGSSLFDQLKALSPFTPVRYKMLENGAKNALSAFHAAGFIHGDVRLQNFCVIDGELAESKCESSILKELN
ncbi:hypothetical protein HDU79_007879 [Rhizoclosmatium sp. JEL0117]|nr:hypothetical protein HDU79_007879 [Rhizoclosmatium sp. JEL0117]